MMTSFIANAETKATVVFPGFSKETSPNREKVKLLAIGSPAGVNSIIRQMYSLGFAEVSEWSPLQPTNNPGEVMSILIKQITIH